MIGCATCRSEYDLLARGREEEHGTIKWDSSVANLGEDAEWSEQRAFVNLPDSWRTLKITIDFKKKKTCPGNTSKLEPGTVLPSHGSENQTPRQALGSLSLIGDSSPPPPCGGPASGLCTGCLADSWDSFPQISYMPSVFLQLPVSRWPPQSVLLQGSTYHLSHSFP